MRSSKSVHPIEQAATELAKQIDAHNSVDHRSRELGQLVINSVGKVCTSADGLLRAIPPAQARAQAKPPPVPRSIIDEDADQPEQDDSEQD